MKTTLCTRRDWLKCNAAFGAVAVLVASLVVGERDRAIGENRLATGLRVPDQKRTHDVICGITLIRAGIVCGQHDATVRQLDVVVVVAPNVIRRTVVVKELVSSHVWTVLRQKASLHLPRDFEILFDLSLT